MYSHQNAVEGPGLLDAMEAEALAVLRAHMEPTPESLNPMLNSMNASCGEVLPNDPLLSHNMPCSSR